MLVRDYKALLTAFLEAGYEGSMNEKQKAFLSDQGYTDQLNEAWYKYLRSQSYTGQLSEMANQWLKDGLPLGSIDAPVAAGGLADQTYTQNSAITPFDVSSDFTGSGITYALSPSSASLPSGLTLSTSGIISGTPTTTISSASIIIRGTNVSGYADSAFSLTVNAAATLAVLSNYIVDDTNGTIAFDSTEAGTGKTFWDTTPSYASGDAAAAAIGSAAYSVTYAVSSGHDAPSLSVAGLPNGSYYAHTIVTNGAGNSNCLSAAWTQAIQVPTLNYARLRYGFSTIDMPGTQNWDTGSAPATSDFQFYQNGSPVSLSSVSIDSGDNTLVTAALASAVSSTDDITFDYTGTSLQNAGGGKLASITGQVVQKQLVPDHGLDNPSSWNTDAGVSITGSAAVWDGTNAANAAVAPVASPLPVAAGKTYRIEFTVESVTGSVSLFPRIDWGGGGSEVPIFNSVTPQTYNSSDYTATAGSTSAYFTFYNNTANGVVSVGDIKLIQVD